jgi:fructose-bisphosphate aldolase class I
MSTFAAELIATARAIASPGKGILAADESTGTIGKRFAAIDVENIQENRMKYRKFLFETEGLSEYISGVIMYEETLFDAAPDGKPLVEICQENGMIPGIKVDMGKVPLPGTDGETVTQGLTNLGDRCAKYYAKGARFAKWRAVLKISDSGCPSQLSIQQNAETLARYAAICQANGLVPIVEPEVLMDGSHSLAVCAAKTQAVQAMVMKKLHDHNILWEGMLLKPNMCVHGAECATPSSDAECATATVRVLQRTLPAACPGVHFLSGGMSEVEATSRINFMNKLELGARPWSLSFSFGRALQKSCLAVWQGKDENIPAAQEALLFRAKQNSLANLGQYKGEDGASDIAAAAASASMYVKNYSY